MWSRIAQFSSLVFLLLCVSGNHKISALKFDLAGATDENQLTCIGQYIPKDLMVAVEVILGEGFQQTVDLVVRDRNGGNQYYKKKNLKSGELKFAFTSHEWTDVEFCFSNLLDQGQSPNPRMFRTVHLHVDTGAEAQDYNEVAKKEKLTLLETELTRLENMIASLESDIGIMHRGEAELRDLNEDANERVKYFSMTSIFIIVVVGLWQIYYLRSFFKAKKLI